MGIAMGIFESILGTIKPGSFSLIFGVHWGMGLPWTIGDWRMGDWRLKTILREWETSVGHGHICLFYGCIEGHVKITEGMFTSTGISETYKLSVVVISLS